MIHKLKIAAAVAVASTALFTGTVYAASANASINIATPLVISQVADLSFGDTFVPATGGTVVVSTAGVATQTGDVVLPTGTVTAAEFDVVGETSSAYTVTLPTTATMTNGVTGTITVDGFNHNATEVLNVSGAETFQVGATATLAAAQESGAYTGSFDVTVAY